MMTNSKEPLNLRDNYVTYFDHTDRYCRAVWAVPSGATSIVTLDGDKFEFQRAEHKLPFIPWVVVDFGEPMFETIYRAGIYDHLAQVNAVFQAKLLEYGAQSNDVYNTIDPDNPNIVRGGELGAPEILDQQTTKQRLPPTPPDPSLQTSLQMLTAQMIESAAVTPLLNVGDIGGNTPFMSINARQSTAVAQLGVVQQVVERAVEQGLYQNLQWIDYDQSPVIGYRTRTKNGTMMGTKGMPLMIQSSKAMGEGAVPPNVTYFDIDKTHVTVKLKPQLIQDKQAEAALAQLRQAVGYSRRKSLEDMGVDNPEMMLEDKYVEVLDDGAIQLEIQKQQMKAQFEIEMAKMQAQMQMQQQQMQAEQQAQAQAQQQPQSPENQANAANAVQYQPTQGMDARFGGPAPTQVVPGRNRPQVTQRDDRGNPVA